MIKKIWILLLVLSLTMSAVGCRRAPDDPSDQETAHPSHSTETEADTRTEPDTGSDTVGSPENSTEGKEPEVNVPELPPVSLVASYFESVTVDGVPCFTGEGDRDKLLTAAGDLIPIPAEPSPVALSVSGWIGYDRPIDAFGFSLDGAEPTFGNFSLFTEDNVKLVGGEDALRFAIHIPLFELAPGSHTLELLARLHDGTVVRLRHAVTLKMDGLIPDTSIPYHTALTHINGSSCGSCTGDLSAGMASANGSSTQVGDDGRIQVSGWLATEGGVERYVWSVDGINWYDAETGGQTGEPSGVSFSSLGYENAAVNALFTNLVLNLTLYENQTVDVLLGAIPRNAPENVIPMARITDLTVPDQLTDIVFSFRSDVTANPDGTDLRACDLADQFFINYGVGDPRCVTDYEGTLCYVLEGIHEMYTNVDGRYALSGTFTRMDSAAFMLVRGYHSVISDDILENGDISKGQYQLHSFYETDCAGAMGGAGIYAGIHDGTLTVIVKYYDPNCISRVGNHITTVDCTGSTLTMADDGSAVSIFVDGKRKVTVRLRGEVTYSDINNITPYGTFAASAVISVVGGSSQTVQNTLVASSCISQCGITIRGGSVCFKAFSLAPLAESGLPDM